MVLENNSRLKQEEMIYNYMKFTHNTEIEFLEWHLETLGEKEYKEMENSNLYNIQLRSKSGDKI